MIIENLPWKSRDVNKRWVSHKISEDLILEQWVVPKGTEVQIKATLNFGWVVLPENTQDIRGFVIPKRMFQY